MTLTMPTSLCLSISILTTAQLRVLRTSLTCLPMIYKLLVTGLMTLNTRSTVLRPHQCRQHQHRLLPVPHPRVHLPASPVNSPSISLSLKMTSKTLSTSSRSSSLKTTRATTMAIRASIPTLTLLATVSTMARPIVSPASCQMHSLSLRSVSLIISNLHMGS